jgi:ribosomal protein S18 acetylase RimI-like enzyme
VPEREALQEGGGGLGQAIERGPAGLSRGIASEDTAVRFSIRRAGEDEPFLSEMLYEAMMWRPGPRRFSREEVLSLPEIAVYIGEWGRSGDVGLVAEGNRGEPIGAAWYRFFSEEAHGFGFVNAETPEITIAVREDWRGRGIGGALLEELITQGRERRVPALSLSVEPDNPALRLYERASFRVIRRDKVLTMICDLASAKRCTAPTL